MEGVRLFVDSLNFNELIAVIKSSRKVDNQDAILTWKGRAGELADGPERVREIKEMALKKVLKMVKESWTPKIIKEHLSKKNLPDFLKNIYAAREENIINHILKIPATIGADEEVRDGERVDHIYFTYGKKKYVMKDKKIRIEDLPHR